MTLKSITILFVGLALVLIDLSGCSKDNIGIPAGAPIPGGSYYVATSGSDDNPGTFNSPLATWQKAVELAEAGDTVYIRGGVYFITQNDYSAVRIHPWDKLGHSGTESKPICFFNYPGETPILDGAKRDPTNGWNNAFDLMHAHYWHFRGLTIRNFLQNNSTTNAGGIGAVDCCNLTLENITVSNCGGAGITVLGAWMYQTSPGVYFNPEHLTMSGCITKFINCDSYDNCDSYGLGGYSGGRADGFKFDDEKGAYFLFDGCRAWNNSDDGFDPSGDCFGTVNNCWAFSNGRLNGDGNGFKMCSPRSSQDQPLYKLRTYSNNLSVYNRAAGFNENIGGTWKVQIDVFNNTSYKNGSVGFGNQAGAIGISQQNLYRNNISFKNASYQTGFGSSYIHDHNSWDSGITMTDADLVNIDSHLLVEPRQGDGSLPNLNIFRLAKGSKLSGAGINVGMSNTPDIGIDWAYLNRK
jgi:hypothetical protein